MNCMKLLKAYENGTTEEEWNELMKDEKSKKFMDELQKVINMVVTKNKHEDDKHEVDKSRYDAIEDKYGKINHPLWYKWLKDEIGVEVIELCELFTFNRGSALKYLLRAGIKTEKGYSVPEKEIEDLEKAKWYIEREIKNLKDMLK